ncbi:hypothetical protein [Liquorilactobacillus uvarum]|uniref:hypothetical protein n=1 Tax=Liquorilactobacillus uvarum TaxID=303240 RepID=UPI00288A4E9D|nr:hypothetical protein [Liquorilactobacillus uvarum]
MKKIKMNYAKQHIQTDKTDDDTWPLLKSSLFYNKSDEKYCMYISMKASWLVDKGRQQQELVFCEKDQIDKLFESKINKLTPFVLIEDSKKQVKPIIDNQLMKYELVGIKLQNEKSILIISSSDLLIFLRYIDHSPKMVES